MTESTKNIPTVFVIFGATGDLMEKKIAPALFHLYSKDKLPKLFRVIGSARRLLSDEEFRRYIAEIIRRHGAELDRRELDHFLEYFSYHQGELTAQADYDRLANILGRIDGEWKVCANKLFYLAVPPPLYETVFTHLAASGLTDPCSPEEGWTRLIVEKPFGKDLVTAEKLDALLGKLFKEIQVYRIDHYLGKEMIQNLLSFRFSNNIFEETWNKEFIERIEIRLLETMGVEGRGAFYDGLGALRDVGQNHLLQMLAFTTMDHPGSFQAVPIREKRAELLSALRKPSEDDIVTRTFRAQYKGYRDHDGVAKDSPTETYFQLAAFLETPRWKDVPITLESGKRMAEARKEIVVTFRHPTPCLCPPGSGHYKNKVVISLEPTEGIRVHFWSKKPGFEYEIEERTFEFLLRDHGTRTQYTEEYEKLLLDCIKGDQTLFVSTDEVKAMWRFIDPIVKGWEARLAPLHFYTPGTNEAREASRFLDEGRPVEKQALAREIAIVGLGKMGSNLARRLITHCWRVVGFNRTPGDTKKLEEEGLAGAYSLSELAAKLPKPRLIWLMVPAGKPVDEALDQLLPHLSKGDVVVDGGNSFYKDSIRRFKRLTQRGVHFVDVGVSGGPSGALNGASLMIGGEKRDFDKLRPLFADLAVPNGYQFFHGAGAGHFVKMIHNGIEYGMMQAIAEGFTILQKAPYKLDLTRVADVYNHGSVIESRLIGWLKKAFDLHGEEFHDVSGSVGRTGEGEWTIKTAKELKVKAKVIEEALQFRIESEKHPSFAGKVLSALREQFGGHSIKKGK